MQGNSAPHPAQRIWCPGEAPHNWLTFGHVLAAWNAGAARPGALRGYDCVSARAARRAYACGRSICR